MSRQKEPKSAKSLRYPRSTMVTALLLGGGALAVVVYAAIVVAAGELHADFSDTILWAEATYLSGKLFDPDFYYVYTIPFGGQWLMIPFLAIFGMGMAAQTAGMVLFALLLAVAVALLGHRALKFSPLWTGVLTAAALLGVSGSPKMRELYWGHVIHYSLGSLFLVIGLTLAIAALDRSEENGSGRKKIAAHIIAGLWTFLCSLNGLQSILTFALPLLAALTLEKFLDTRRPLEDLHDAQWRITVVIALSCLAGVAAGTILTADVPSGYAAYYRSLSGPDNWMDNLLKLPRDWLTLTGYAPTAGTQLVSPKGIAYLMKFPGAVCIALAPFVLVMMLGRVRNRGVRLLALAHMTLSGAIGFAFVFGQISDVNWRLSPLVFTAFLATVALAWQLWQDAKLRRFALVVLLPVALYVLVAAAQIVTTPPDFRRQNLYYRMGEFLQENSLDTGYATFWNASSVTLQSDGKVRIAPIVIESGKIKPYRYQSHRTWYESDEKQDAWFVLLSDAEFKTLSTMDPAFVENASQKLAGPENYTLLVFAENIHFPDN